MKYYIKEIHIVYPYRGIPVRTVTIMRTSGNPIGFDYETERTRVRYFPATEEEYKAFQREIRNMSKTAVRIRPDYYDNEFGDSIYMGDTFVPNRRQRKELFKNQAFTELCYSMEDHF